jgi:hypothetical protein
MTLAVETLDGAIVSPLASCTEWITASISRRQ